MKEILCSECQRRIHRKKDLVVAGKIHQPYHKKCYKNPRSLAGKFNRFSGSFPLGMRFWLVFIVANGICLEILKHMSDSLLPLPQILAVFNVLFLGTRLGIYLSYERHLK